MVRTRSFVSAWVYVSTQGQTAPEALVFVWPGLLLRCPAPGLSLPAEMAMAAADPGKHRSQAGERRLVMGHQLVLMESQLLQWLLLDLRAQAVSLQLPGPRVQLVQQLLQ